MTRRLGALRAAGIMALIATAILTTSLLRPGQAPSLCPGCRIVARCHDAKLLLGDTGALRFATHDDAGAYERSYCGPG